MTSAAGGLIGALLHNWASNRWLNGVFGILLVFAAVLLGGLVGKQRGLRSAALLGFDLSKHSFVATATAIGLVADGARMPVYLMMQSRELAERATWIDPRSSPPVAVCTKG